MSNHACLRPWLASPAATWRAVKVRSENAACRAKFLGLAEQRRSVGTLPIGATQSVRRPAVRIPVASAIQTARRWSADQERKTCPSPATTKGAGGYTAAQAVAAAFLPSGNGDTGPAG